MTSPIEFGELPADTRRSGNWVDIAAQLRARPGEWAKIRTFPSKGSAGASATHIKKGTYEAMRPAGAFDATSRGCDVWARYIGGTS